MKRIRLTKMQLSGWAILLIAAWLLIPQKTLAVEIEMVSIPGGSFSMGSINGGRDELPVHRVHIQAFKMSKYEITQAQWQAVMGNNPSRFKGDNLPVERVNWSMVQLFIKHLNSQTGKRYRLPTEAEWEYAARAGSSSEFSWGDKAADAEAYAWFKRNSAGKTHPVGQKRPNNFGLYDMQGNVWEWIDTCYQERYDADESDIDRWPTGECKQRVLRGGSWDYSSYYMRSALRIWDGIFEGSHNMGIRLALD